MIRQKNLKAEEKLRSRRTEVNLYFLRNDLDIWHRQVICLIDNKKTIPSKDVITKLGIEVVQKLYIRRVLTKKDIDEMKFPELPLTSKRSWSASPNRPTTPDSASKRSISITRDSPKERHSDCQKKLDFNDDEDGYKVDTDIKPASCTCAQSKVYYKCRISLLEKQKVELEKELQRYINVTSDRMSSDNTTTKYKEDNDRLRKERNSARIELQRVLSMNRFTEEKANSGYEMLQNDIEICKHQKKVLENERNELQKENIILEKELQSLNSKLEQFDDSAKNISNMKKQIKDLEEGFEESNREKSTLDKENNKLKYIIQEKVSELKTLETRYQKETSDRMSSDNASTKLKDENERLRKERNSAKIELQRLLRENNKSYQNLETEQVLAREELQRREREKYELVALFKDKKDKDLKKINLYEKEIETLKSRLIGEKANQYSAYELLQTKHQNKALEVECYELQKENIELENELQSLNSKLEQFDDTAKNISNMKKQIKDLEEGSENMCIRLSEKDKELNHLKSVLNKAKFKSLELVADLDSGESMSDIEDENEKLQRNLSRLYEEINKTNKGIALNAQLMSARNQKDSKETSMSPGEGKITTGVADVNSYKNSENNESGSEHPSACSGKGMIMSLSSYLNSTRHIVSEQHRTININAKTVQISDNASITMSSNTSVDENRRHFEVDEPENQRQQEIEN